MAITELQISDFRNLSTASLIPSPLGLNMIYGLNGSGKTSLLEAIHFIGLGRSFRSSVLGRLIKHDKDKFSLFAHVLTDSLRTIPVGVEREAAGTTRLRVGDRNDASLLELATFLPIRLVNAASHELFESGPVFRRKFLDWGLFYQDERFLTCWRNYERVLKHRNVLLRDRRPRAELDPWTEELIKLGLVLDNLRREYIALLLPILLDSARALLLEMPDLEVRYYPGWDDSLDFADALAEAFMEEHRFGYTALGPHRADLSIQIDAIPAKHFLSRGQQKLLVCAMMVAQGQLLAQQTKKGVVYLIDDLPAELDRDSRQRLIALLSQQPTQIFITAIEYEDEFDIPKKVFHVEHGNVKEVTRE